MSHCCVFQGMLKFTFSTIKKTVDKIRENSGAMAILHQLYELLGELGVACGLSSVAEEAQHWPPVTHV